MDFWRVSAPFPGPGPLQDDRAHRDGDFAQGPVSVAWKVSENEPFEVFNENFWKLLINHPAFSRETVMIITDSEIPQKHYQIQENHRL